MLSALAATAPLPLTRKKTRLTLRVRRRPLDLAAAKAGRARRDGAGLCAVVPAGNNPVPAPAKAAVGAKIYLVDVVGNSVGGNAELPERAGNGRGTVTRKPAIPIRHAEGAF